MELVALALDAERGGGHLKPDAHQGASRHMTTFDERESSFEAKFKHDKELQFRVNNRRNKLLGLWAANLLGVHGAEAEAYAKEVVKSDFATPGDHDVLHKVLADFQAKKVEMSEHRLRKQMDDLMKIAADQIRTEVKAD
jgi:hypothetical protein